MENLYRAARSRDAEPLGELSHSDATILANIPDGRQTPLHISSLLGHLPFTVVLLNHNGNLAIRKDSCGRTALHLASAEGHIDIVKELLQVNNDPCLNGDKQGRIPLHYAAMRGRTEVVQELIMARPDSLSHVDGEQSTVFHSCVTHNHLNTLETLVNLDYATANITIAGQPPSPTFMGRDRDGDTILHLAITLKRVEVVSYLLSIPEIREMANLENNRGFTAHDILKRSPKDFKIREIQHLLTKAEKEGFETDVVPPHNDGCWVKILKGIRHHYLRRIIDWLTHDEDIWLDEMRGHLTTVSTFIATVTFQGLINPPGGFIQQGLSSSKGNTTSSNQVLSVTSSDDSSNQVLNVTSSDDPLSCTTFFPDNHTYCPGQALASSSHLYRDFERYLFYITLSFLASLSVTLLLVSGIFPMNRAMMRMLSIGMFITLTSLAAAYITAFDIVIPSHILQQKLIFIMKDAALYRVWKVLLFLIVTLISMRFLLWVIKKSSSWKRESGWLRFLSLLLRFTTFFFMPSVPGIILILFTSFFKV